MSTWPTPTAQQSPAWNALVTEIIPRLYISDLYSAEDPALLSALGITHVLSTMPGYIAIPAHLALRHAQIPLDDLPFSELVAHLPKSTAFLRDALRDPNARVLVHCVEGVSRSVSVVCAFLMYAYGWAPMQAVQYVKSKRVRAEPNFGFVSQLHEYAELIRQARS
jgi:atypical dual specificity phosphatase